MLHLFHNCLDFLIIVNICKRIEYIYENNKF